MFRLNNQVTISMSSTRSCDVGHKSCDVGHKSCMEGNALTILKVFGPFGRTLRMEILS